MPEPVDYLRLALTAASVHRLAENISRQETLALYTKEHIAVFRVEQPYHDMAIFHSVFFPGGPLPHQVAVCADSSPCSRLSTF